MRAFLLSVFTLFVFTANAQLNLNWLQQGGTSLDDYGIDIATDDDGNVYWASNWFEYNATVAKYTNAGVLIGAINFGDDGPTNSLSIAHIAVDADQNIYISGRFTGTIDVNSGTAIVNLTAPNVFATFIVKYNSNMDYVWSIALNATGGIYPAGLDVDNNGNIYTTGFFNGNCNFNPAGTAVLTTGINGKMFIAKYDGNGNYIWAKGLEGNSIAPASTDLCTGTDGNIYITGSFGNGNFNPNGTANLTAQGNGDVFIAKYDDNGNYVWAVPIGGTGIDRSNSICIDNQGNILIAGNFQDTANFNPSGIANLISAGSFDAYLAKYDEDGNYILATQIGGSDESGAYDIVTDNNGDMYVTGMFNGGCNFNVNGIPAVLNSNSYDIFIAKYRSNGNYIWAKALGGAGNDVAYSVATDSNKVYISGSFTQTADFNPGIGFSSLTSNGMTDGFIAAYSTPSSAAEIVSFTMPQQVSPAVINHANKTVNITVLSGTIPSFLTPTITVSPGAGISPSSDTPQNFTTPFTYVVTAEDGLVQNNWLVTVSVSTGVEEHSTSTITIYPNPAHNNLVVDMPNLKGKEVFTLMDVRGKTVLTQTLVDAKSTINLQGINAGLYLWRIGSKAGKLVVE